MIYRRSLFSPRRFSSKGDECKDLQCSVLPENSGKMVNPLANGAEALVDKFTYLLSGAMTSRKLQEILDQVRHPEVRLCLRAHGQMQQLLRCLQQDVEEKGGRLLRLGCWHCLSLDAFTSAELLDACWASLSLEVHLAPNSCSSSLEAAGVTSTESSLKRRRKVQVGASEESEEEIRQHLARVLQEERFSQMEAGADERSLSLLILWRCLGNLQPEAQPKAMAHLWTWFPRVLKQQASQLLWEAFERLARQGAPSHVGQEVLVAARQTLTDVSMSASGKQSCLRALHALVTYGPESLTSCFFPTEMLELLMSWCENLETSGPSARTALGILGNLASRSEEFCKELSRRPKTQPFALSLAKSLVWYKEQVSQESSLEVEVHLNYAMASLLMGWMAWGSSEAQQHLEDQLGSTQVLLDLLRTFTVFQDRCGTLTDSSLLCVHSIMQFLAEAAGKSDPATPDDGKGLVQPVKLIPRPVTPATPPRGPSQPGTTPVPQVPPVTPPRPRETTGRVTLKPRPSSPVAFAVKNDWQDKALGPEVQVYRRRREMLSHDDP